MSFVSLRLASVGFPRELIPLVMTANTWIQVVGSRVFAEVAQQGGIWGRNGMLFAGLGVLVAANLCFILLSSHAGRLYHCILHYWPPDLFSD